MSNLASDPGQAARMAEFRALLESIVDSEAVAREARVGFGIVDSDGVDLRRRLRAEG